MILRELTLSDVEAAARIDCRCFAAWIAYPYEIFEECILSASCESVGVEEEGALAGFFIVFYSGPYSAQVITIDVDPDFRGMGFGKVMMEELENRARQKGVRRMFLQVSVKNHPAQSLYKKFGYHVRRILYHYYGPGYHAYLMEKDLSCAAAASGI